MRIKNQRQLSGEATQGYIAFLKGQSFNQNPCNTPLKYKNWCDGYRNGEKATENEIKYFTWIYSF